MNILAIDLSSSQNSLALVTESGTQTEKNWIEAKKGARRLFDEIPALLSETSMNWEDIDGYAVGRGPGRFSGLRIGLASVQSFALPDKKPVYAISSGEALAYETASQTTTPYIAVVGDARRQQCWLGLFKIDQNNIPSLCHSWRLVPPNGLENKLQQHTLIVSSEWDRLEPVLNTLKKSGCSAIKENRYPSARIVGEIAIQRILKRQPGEPLTPLYMHPPVFVNPMDP